LCRELTARHAQLHGQLFTDLQRGLAGLRAVGQRTHRHSRAVAALLRRVEIEDRSGLLGQVFPRPFQRLGVATAHVLAHAVVGLFVLPQMLRILRREALTQVADTRHVLQDGVRDAISLLARLIDPLLYLAQQLLGLLHGHGLLLGADRRLGHGRNRAL